EPLAVHGLRDQREVLEELGGDVLVSLVASRQLEGQLEQGEAVHRHPGGSVRLLQVAGHREHARAVEGPDVVQPQEAALEHVVTQRVLTVNPPGEVEEQLVEYALQEVRVAPAVDRPDAQGGPRMYGR